MRVRHRLFCMAVELEGMLERGEIAENLKAYIKTSAELLKTSAAERKWVFPEEEIHVDKVEGSDG